jgi:predicted nucleic acid-binding protein
MRFLDTNIILRAITIDDPIKTHACAQLFLRVRRREEQLETSQSVIAESVYVLSSPRWYNLPRAEIVAKLRPIIALRGLKLSQKRIIIHALLIYYQYPHLDFEDALSVALMQHDELTKLVSYDTDFDAIPGITREEP